jgi:hypothetical protein
VSSVDLGWLEIERARYENLLDGTTGLPGWTLLIDRVGVALARARRSENQVGVFVIVEPRLPNKAYDALQVVEASQSRLRPDDSLARLASECDAEPALWLLVHARGSQITNPKMYVTRV